jgi:LysM repeat protein
MQIYVVRRGDTLGKIASRFYGSSRKFPLIVAVNRIADPDRLVVGQKLTIPDDLGAGSPTLPSPSVTVGAPPILPINETRLAPVHPGLAARARAMLALCAQRELSLLITQGLRTWPEQDRLYAIGRTTAPIGKKYIVTNAKGGQSYHNFGLAFDIVVLDSMGKADWDSSHPGWAIAAEVGKSVGLDWGGDWTGFKDMPHFQYTGGVSLARCRELYLSGIEQIWAEVGGFTIATA